MAETTIRMRKGIGGARVPMVEKARKRCWSEKRRAVFLDHLAQTCNIVASLRKAGMSATTSLYELRRRDARFRAAWDEALAHGYARLEAELLDRALNGRRVMVEREGAMIETIEISDTLGLKLLSHHRRAVADYRAAVATMAPREDVCAVRSRIVERIMTIVDALPDASPQPDGLPA